MAWQSSGKERDKDEGRMHSDRDLEKEREEIETRDIPAIMSAPPLMNLEILWRTTSAPRRAGESSMGAKVLSTTTVTPLR